ncbi:HemK2/MTQ2 family protein methyltransferase [Williamsia deligens]|uniref:HemK2/MTQ2 family protein methyltransferase n=1 Tax=Williamsia deligens TaxID=321325 RepID=A0ABW3GEX4_9NOCA|nr:HemK2/MTQ2 family protein methyltransferase [Williamsia deligens]MCP2195941.1 release factor glutamine methyltransferase [Williamsia deligens]
MLLQTPAQPTHQSGPPTLTQRPLETPSAPSTEDLVVGASVYAPQGDSHMLVEAMRAHAEHIRGGRVVDLCCGSGIAAVSAARLGAAEVLALDLNPAAVASAAANALRHAPAMHARRGTLTDAVELGPFDVLLCNPPYVPAPDDAVDHASAASAWDAGHDGRMVLDPLCRMLPDILGTGGMALIVHSEVADFAATVDQCRAAGLTADVIARTHVPLGPVMRERADWLAQQGHLPAGAEAEELAVVRVTR